MGSMYFPENTVPATAGSTGADTSVAASVAARNARAGRPRTDVKVSTSFFLGRSCAALVTQARRLDATRGFARCVSGGHGEHRVARKRKMWTEGRVRRRRVARLSTIAFRKSSVQQ